MTELPTLPPADSIKVRSRKQSAVIALAVALVTAAVFAAVLLFIHSNNVQTTKSRDFSREVSCQLIAATQDVNASTLSGTLQQYSHGGISAKQAAQIEQAYKLRLTEAIEKRLGVTGKAFINPDGSLNCQAYVRIGSRSGPITSSSSH